MRVFFFFFVRIEIFVARKTVIETHFSHHAIQVICSWTLQPSQKTKKKTASGWRMIGPSIAVAEMSIYLVCLPLALPCCSQSYA